MSVLSNISMKKKQYRILQSSMSLCSEGMENNLVIVFMNHSKVESVHIISYPEWYVFYDPNYPYYQFCCN